MIRKRSLITLNARLCNRSDEDLLALVAGTDPLLSHEALRILMRRPGVSHEKLADALYSELPVQPGLGPRSVV